MDKKMDKLGKKILKALKELDVSCVDLKIDEYLNIRIKYSNEKDNSALAEVYLLLGDEELEIVQILKEYGEVIVDYSNKSLIYNIENNIDMVSLFKDIRKELDKIVLKKVKEDLKSVVFNYKNSNKKPFIKSIKYCEKYSIFYTIRYLNNELVISANIYDDENILVEEIDFIYIDEDKIEVVKAVLEDIGVFNKKTLNKILKEAAKLL